MQRSWSNPASPAYLSTPRVLYGHLKAKGHHVSRRGVRDFVRAQRTYQLTRTARRPRKFVPYLVTAPFMSQQCDLAFFNGNRHRVLVCADVHSSHISAALLGPRKTARATWTAYEKILGGLRRQPVYMSHDYGGEFLGAHFKQQARARGIKLRPLRTYQHAAVAERAIGKIRAQWRRVRAHIGTKDIRKHLRAIVTRLNSTPHAVTGIAPRDVTYASAGTVFDRRYGRYSPRKGKFKVGDRVRVSNVRAASARTDMGERPPLSFSTEVFRVAEARRTDPPTYVLEDYKGTQLDTFFYENQLQWTNTSA